MEHILSTFSLVFAVEFFTVHVKDQGKLWRCVLFMASFKEETGLTWY